MLVNGRVSDAFPLARGTRQGCTLSPILYALAVEPLASSLRSHPGVEGLGSGNLVETLSLYADDMLLYLADAGPLLSNALQTIQAFGNYSGLKINWDKSQVLPVDMGAPTESQASSPFLGFSTIKYLGIVITRFPEDFVKLNIEPVIATLKIKTQTWAKLPLGVMGRVNLIKMVILPKFLYVLWHAPGYIPLRIFKSIKAILNSFGARTIINCLGKY